MNAWLTANYTVIVIKTEVKGKGVYLVPEHDMKNMLIHIHYILLQ